MKWDATSDKKGEARLLDDSDWPIWQYGLQSFQTGYIKMEIFLPKNIPKGNF